jgi:perosamine synthetase
MQKNKRIPQSEPLFSRLDKNALKNYISTDAWFTENKVTKQFEEKFAKFVKSKYAVTFPNGTLTLFAMLKCLHLPRNSEIIVPSYTMVATANSVVAADMKVKFSDIDRKNLCLCPKNLIKNITKKTKVIIYVTLNGRTGHFNKIKDICKKRNIILLEDSAHSLGGYDSKRNHHGTKSFAASFSFSTPKLFSTGQGGMVITNNKKYFLSLKRFKNFGRIKDGNDQYKDLGLNFKFTDLQATLGISQMSDIDAKISKKKKIFNTYYKNLNKIKDIEFKNFSKNECPWFIDIYLNNPSKLKKYLEKFNIQSRLVYPSLNTQKFFKHKSNCPISEKYCSRGLWLPSSLALKNSEIIMICKKIKNFFLTNDH